MNNLLQYLFEVILGSSVLFLGYALTKNYLTIAFRRFFLLSCLFLPLVFPLISFDTSEKIVAELPDQVNHLFDAPLERNHVEEISTGAQLKEVTLTEQDQSIVNSSTEINWTTLSIILYLVVSACLFIRMCLSLISLLRLIKNPVTEFNGQKLYVIDNQQFSGGSFFHFIFINKELLNDPVMEIIISHEQVHHRLWHSVDILCSELYCIVFWINPISWFFRNEIRLNTEYQADLLATKGIDRQHYSNTLLNLSIHSQNLLPVISFSAINIRSRINFMLQGKRYHWSRSLLTIPFLILTTWLISCEPEMMDFTAMDPQTALKNVKTVTTRYISHQKDTQQKDGKVIALAYYLPDGTVDKVEQHTTYPYDYKKPFKRSFISSPNPVGVLHLMDGFDLGEAMNNILYGNDWPKYKDVDDFGKKGERITRKTTIKKNDFGLPTSYIIDEELNEDIFYQGEERYSKGMVMNRHEETFNYSNGKVISHSRNTYYPAREILMKNLTLKNVDYQPPSKQLLHETHFFYEGENLIKVTNNAPQNGSFATTKMQYENGIMTSASYFREDKQYNHREFFYDESGLKTRTEIYNVYGEPEYTITYDYEYY
ncbi:MAG: M56 family metallopeptidase [Cyclobacteriaceae bacterium]